jgi:hypothetical protein
MGPCLRRGDDYETNFKFTTLAHDTLTINPCGISNIDLRNLGHNIEYVKYYKVLTVRKTNRA